MNAAIQATVPQNKKPVTLIAYILLFLVSVWFVYWIVLIGTENHPGLSWIYQDWRLYFRPAALELLAGRSPYIPGFYNLPWALLPLLPLVALPVELGSAIIFVANLFSYIYVAHKLGARLFAIIIFLITIYPILNSLNCNIDGLIALGFILPPQIGLFFILVKPQIGLPIAIFWLVETLRGGGISLAARRFAPVTIAFLLSFALFGFWPLSSSGAIDAIWNSSIWPHGILIGLALLGWSIILRRKELSISAGPYLSPYLAPQSWAFAWLGILPFIPSIPDIWQAIRKTAHYLAQLIA